MESYKFTEKLQSLWHAAVSAYQAGERDANAMFSDDDKTFLAHTGLRPMEVFDPVEDSVKSGEPDFGTFLVVAAIRRDFFLHEQGGQWSENRISMEDLPAKTEAVDGIEWLPRIIPKARAKLRGEMPDDLMYGCGGDRRFFRRRDIHPGDFLNVVRRAGDNDRAIIDWVASHPVVSDE